MIGLVVRAEYSRKVRRLLGHLARISEALDREPIADSRTFYAPSARSLAQLQAQLRDAVASEASRQSLLELADEIKRVLTYVGASSSKGDVRITAAIPLEEAMDLVCIFQEGKYAALWPDRTA
jgi:hypothetical protein